MKITVEFNSLAEFEAFRAPGAAAPTPAPTPTPVPSPPPAPAQYLPPVRVLTMPARAVPGTLRWTSEGNTYVAAVVTNGDIVIAGLYSASGTGDAVQMTRLEQMLDNRLDTNPPEDSEAGLREWLTTRILPALNTWVAANSGRMAGAVFAPVSVDVIPAEWSVFDRAAALLAQGVKIGPRGFAL